MRANRTVQGMVCHVCERGCLHADQYGSCGGRLQTNLPRTTTTADLLALRTKGGMIVIVQCRKVCMWHTPHPA
jgi:hypothetical protein